MILEICLFQPISEFPINEVKLLNKRQMAMKMNNQAFKALLITKGRISGKEHSVWLRAVMYNDKIYFSRRNLNGDWLKNAIKNPIVIVQFDDLNYEGNASIVSDEQLSKKISELKYDDEVRKKESRVVLEVVLNQTNKNFTSF